MTRWLLLAFVCAACGPNDVQLDPPAIGFQLKTDSFTVPQGTEQQRCYFFRVPGSGADIWVTRFQAALNAGSHHMNVFRVRTILALDGEDGTVVDGGECWKSGNWADWPLVVNSQEGGDSVDWQLPAGVAAKFTPGEKLMLQTHFVNARTQQTPGKGKAIVNFDAVADASGLVEMGTVFATDQHIRICPGDTNVSFAQTCRFARQPVTIIAANGHFHSRGVKFEMSPSDAQNQPGANFYTSTEWADPVFFKALNVPVEQNGGVFFRCTYSMAPQECADSIDQCCATFGPHVETQEHCNAFVYYYPKLTDATCF